MKYFGSKRRFRRVPRTGRRARKYWKKKVSRPIRKYIKAVVGRNIETKDYPFSLAQNIYEQNSYTGAQSQCVSLIPALAKGTGNGQIVGDKITVKSLRLKSIITLSQPGANGHFVRVVIFSIKDFNADVMGSTCPAIEFQNFFRNGTSTVAPSGYLYVEGMAPINTNRISVHYDKQHFMGTNVVPVNSSSGHTNGGDSGRPFVKLNWSMKKSQIWKYDENATNPNLPLNHNLFMVVFCNDAGGALGSGSTQIANNYSFVDVKYKDA